MDMLIVQSLAGHEIGSVILVDMLIVQSLAGHEIGCDIGWLPASAKGCSLL